MAALTPELTDFLRRYLDSVESIEIVALLQRSSTAYWTPHAVAQQLGIPEAVAASKLGAMSPHLLVRGPQTGAYRYAPEDEEMARACTELLQVYSEQRSVVINAVYSASLHAFSNAFKLKKEP